MLTELEQALGVHEFGWPAVAILADFKRFSVMQGTFNERSLNSYISMLIAGKQTTIAYPVGGLPEAVQTDEWTLTNDVKEEL